MVLSQLNSFKLCTEFINGRPELLKKTDKLCTYAYQKANRNDFAQHLIHVHFFLQYIVGEFYHLDLA